MRLLIVDDHEVVRRGVRSLLTDQPGYEICGEAADGQDAVYKSRTLKPDVVIMDISMPKLNGLEATRLIRSILPECEVLILTQHEPGEMARQAFKAGARGYVLKSAISRDLVAALEKISRHQYFFDRSVSGLANSPAHVDVQEILQRSAAFEEALRHSEELYRSTFELAGVGVAHVSPEGRWLRVNQKLCEILNYTESELLKLSFQEVTHPDDLGTDLRETAKVRSGELERFSMEKRYIRKDGTPVWVNLVVRGVYDAHGKLTHFISVIEDITERREADETRARLAAIVQSSDDAIVSKNLDGIIVSWNAAAARIFGWTSEEAVGKSITLIIPPELQQEEKQILARLRAGQRIDHFETVRVTKSGQKLNVSLTISPIRDSKGRIIGASKIARDITESKRIEQALRDGQAQLSLALESSRTAMFDWDVSQRLGSWNAQLAAIYEFNPKDQYITDAEWQALFHPEDRERLVQEHQAGLSNSKTDLFHYEFRTVPRNGKFRWILSHGRFVRDAYGKAVRMIGTHTDITDRKQVEQALRASESRLRAAFGQTYSFLVLLETDGTIIDANRAALEAAGRTREQVVGRKFWEPWWAPLPEEVAILKEAIVRAATGQSVRQECYFCAGDGSRRFADRTLNPVFDEHGRVIMIVATGLDMSEQKQLRDQLEQRVEQRTHELQESNRELMEHAETVRELSGKLLQAQDAERRRIARELHDSAGQMLAALQMNLIPMQDDAQSLNPEFARTIGECISLVNELTKELRTVSYLLHPPLLDEAGLSSALRWYVEGFSDRSKIDVQLEVPLELGRLPQEMEMTIFRIVQECLTNIHRHSGSTKAAIVVQRSADELLVEIRDYGKGMATVAGNGSPMLPKSGVGIQGMRERVRQLSGELEIQSSPTGTTVTARLPVTIPSLSVA